MKVIRLTYRDSVMEPSVYLLLFFRFAGVYAYERFWGMGAIQTSGLESSEKGWNQRLTEFARYDCDIYIVQDDIDLQEYSRDIKRESGPTILLTKGKLADNAIDYEKYKGQKLVLEINRALYSCGSISPDEKEELDELAAVYDSKELMKLTLRSKYFFTCNDEAHLSAFQEKYESTIAELLASLSKRDCTWGDRRYFHMQYAALNVIYELNCLCVRYKKKLAYSRDSLLRLSGVLEIRIDGLLGDNVKMLEGQIYDDLFQDPNAAYARYVNCCSEDTPYNSYVFFRKGGYWLEFGEDWEQAIKYYSQAVCIYPPYYRAWYKIGLCSRRLEDNKRAMNAYENIRKCLANRIEGKCVRPLEIEHIFMAQVHLAEIWEENGNHESAISELVWAERVWNLIDETSFFGIMCETEDEQEIYRNWTRENLDIENVYERLIVLNTSIGNTEAAMWYQEKLS